MSGGGRPRGPRGSSGRSVVTFSLAGDLWGVDVGQVQEVLGGQDLTPVPLAPPEVAGLLNLRGRVVTVVDLRQRLGRGARSADGPAHVVVRLGEGLVSLLVDGVGDVVLVPADAVDVPPARLAGAPLEGVHQLPDRLLLLLDVDRLVQPSPVAPRGSS